MGKEHEMGIVFTKYHGLGNDYLVYDIKKNKRKLKQEDIVKICDRNFGLGSDGILEGPYYEDDIVGVKIFNPDGSEAEKSGNGVRIFSKYLKDVGYIQDKSFVLHTLGGDVEVTYNNELGTNMTVSMGRVSYQKEDVKAIDVPDEMVDIPLKFGDKIYQATCVDIGNPHCVIPMEEISKELVCKIGAFSETAAYFPERINTQIVKVINRHHIQIEIFERGAGYTLASGSSSCAAAAAMYRLGLVDEDVAVEMPGGTLFISIKANMQMYMTGDVALVGRMELAEEFIQINQIGL